MIREEVREEAELIVHEGGEIPEVAFWNAWFYLTEPPPEGLGLSLERQEEAFLREAVVRRYLLIIERDLTPSNIGRAFYRGPVRARINWQRLRKFLRGESRSLRDCRLKVLGLLEAFLEGLPRDHPLREEALKFREELREEDHG